MTDVTPAPAVSFIVPAYNAAGYVRETLDSVLSDPRQDIEVIVVDDGSTDGTATVLAGLSDPRLRVLRQANKGQNGARNTGMAVCRSEFFVFLDSDDLFEMATLDTLIAALRANPDAAMSYTSFTTFRDPAADLPRNPLRALYRRPSGPMLRHVLQQNFLGAIGACLIRRSAAELAGPLNETLRMCEDWEYFCRLACHGTFIYVPDIIALRYRQHPTSMSSSLGLELASYAEFSAEVFDNPDIAGQFDAGELARLKRSQTATIHAFIAMKALQMGRLGKSVSAIAAAVTLYPRRSVDFLGRYGWSLAQWTLGGLLGRRR